MAVEEPKYKVLRTDGDTEVRLYAPMLVAEVAVAGDMDEASNKGFRLIADYIFGNNLSPAAAGSAKIAMTAPVTVEPQSAKIAMTAPVTLEPQDSRVEGADMQAARQWRVQFVMPAQYTPETIPKPNNPAVSLREVPEKYVVVQKYTGLNTQAKVQRLTEQTVQWVKTQDLRALSAPQLARYDPPWKLPMFRRNEIHIEIAAP
jgi:hypothetical protein